MFSYFFEKKAPFIFLPLKIETYTERDRERQRKRKRETERRRDILKSGEIGEIIEKRREKREKRREMAHCAISPLFFYHLGYIFRSVKPVNPHSEPISLPPFQEFLILCGFYPYK